MKLGEFKSLVNTIRPNSDAAADMWWEWSKELPVLCPHCYEKMQRKCNNRLRKKIKWKCGNGHTVYLDDESMLTKITDDLRKVADDVDILKGAERNETQGKILREQENSCPAEDKKRCKTNKMFNLRKIGRRLL